MLLLRKRLKWFNFFWHTDKTDLPVGRQVLRINTNKIRLILITCLSADRSVAKIKHANR